MSRATHKQSATRSEWDKCACHVRPERRYVLVIGPIDGYVYDIPDDETYVYDDVKELAARVYGVGRAPRHMACVYWWPAIR